eukprot:scaffold48858_cov44-Cyclotella_meneghiniana.AAC.1
MIESTKCSQKNCPRVLLTRQFGSNVTEDHAVNAIGDSPIWDALFIKKFENEVAVKFGGNVAEDPVVNAIGDYNNRRVEEPKS